MTNFRHLFPEHEFRWSEFEGSQLTENGKNEQRRLGKLLKPFLKPSTFLACSSKERSIDSAKAFLEASNPNLTAKIDDKLTRYFDFCQEYVQGYLGSGPTEEDLHLEAHTEKHKITVIEAFQHRICAYEKAIYGSSEFESKLHRDISELSNLELWHKSGLGGGTKNYHMASVVLDLILKNQLKGDSSVLFGHAETVLPVLCLLGVVESYDDWDMSELAPSSANIMFIIGEGELSPVTIAVNEKVVRRFSRLEEFVEMLESTIIPGYTQLEKPVSDRKRRSSYWETET